MDLAGAVDTICLGAPIDGREDLLALCAIFRDMLGASPPADLLELIATSETMGDLAAGLERAARELGHEAVAVDFRKLSGSLGVAADALAGFDAVVVRTMPPGSLEQVVFRMDLLHRLQQRGVRVLNPPHALETCVDKYLASARLEAAGAGSEVMAAWQELVAQEILPGQDEDEF